MLALLDGPEGRLDERVVGWVGLLGLATRFRPSVIGPLSGCVGGVAGWRTVEVLSMERSRFRVADSSENRPPTVRVYVCVCVGGGGGLVTAVYTLYNVHHKHGDSH